MRRARTTTELVTVLFTDIVSSTEIAGEVGDRRWRELVAAHHAIVRRALKRHRGRELDTAGDGFFAVFTKPADAIRCATDVSEDVRELGLEIRTGIHLGEAEVMGPKVGGLAVNTGARIMGVGKAGQVLVSATVREAVAGKDIAFADHGIHELKGLEGEFHLYDVISVDGAARSLPLEIEEARGRREHPPAEVLRVRRWWLIPVGIAILLVGVVWVALSWGGGEEPEARSTSDETAARPLTEADRQVIDVVPESFGDSCVATDPLPGGAVGSVTCTQGEYMGRYTSYASPGDLSQAFVTDTAGLELTGTSCREDLAASDFYTVDGAPRGSLACYVEHPTPLEFVPTIVWTDEVLNIVGHVSTTVVTDYEGNVPDLSLYEWWRTSAGPGPNRNLRQKDDAAELISGTFRSTISEEQAGATNQGGADDRWVGTWTITLDGNEFVESFDDGQTGDHGYEISSELLWGKGDRMVLHRSYEGGVPPIGGITAFCERLTESLRVRLEGDRLVFSDPSPGEACDDFRGVATFQPWERLS